MERALLVHFDVTVIFRQGRSVPTSTELHEMLAADYTTFMTDYVWLVEPSDPWGEVNLLDFKQRRAPTSVFLEFERIDTPKPMQSLKPHNFIAQPPDLPRATPTTSPTIGKSVTESPTRVFLELESIDTPKPMLALKPHNFIAQPPDLQRVTPKISPTDGKSVTESPTLGVTGGPSVSQADTAAVSTQAALDIGFAFTSDAREPTRAEIEKMLNEAATPFYKDALSEVFMNLVDVRVKYMRSTYTGSKHLPVHIEFEATAFFSNNESVPSNSKLLAAMSKFNYPSLIFSYMWRIGQFWIHVSYAQFNALAVARSVEVVTSPPSAIPTSGAMRGSE